MSAMVLGSNDVDADGAVHDQRRYGIAYYGELEKLIEGEEAKLAKMMSDRDMLHGQSTAVAQAKQVTANMITLVQRLCQPVFFTAPLFLNLCSADPKTSDFHNRGEHQDGDPPILLLTSC